MSQQTGLNARLRSIFTVKHTAVAVVVVALVSVQGRARETLESGRQALSTSMPSRAERELGSPPLGGMETEPLVLARRLIPTDATYAVVVGDVTPLPQYLHEGLPILFEYWLLPRKQSTDVRKVDWIITFHQPSESLGVPIRREVGLGPDANAVEVGP
jgi:hypothetical protein